MRAGIPSHSQNWELIDITVSGALAVKRRRTTSSAAKRERQALQRRAAICFRRAVHS